ncbi:MAG: helix-hairpin-helix domain-containing protein [Halanaeroarchaeum sp.]
MGWIDTIRSLLGFDSGDGSSARDGDVEVTVEHEPSPSAEPAESEPLETEGDDAPSGATTEPADDEPVETEPADDEPVETEPATSSTDQRVEDEPSESPDEGSTDPLTAIKGIGAAYAQRLSEGGIESVGDLASADADDLAERTGISAKRIDRWIDRAKARE